MLLAWIIIALILAAIPAALLTVNLPVFQPPPQSTLDSPAPAVSVVIPARNEAQHIRAAAESVLAGTGVTIELIILDDHSTDQTAEIIRALARRDSRIRLCQSTELPEAWCGKQHACWLGAQQAQYELIVFMDADVELAPDALSRMANIMHKHDLPLASGFPRQKTGTFFEKLLIPLMHFVLLGFLPLRRMRKSSNPAYSAGCGQLFIARKSCYMSIGGHSAIRSSRHDGITLPRAFRAAGFTTDLFDATDLASCRMYQSSGQVFNGLAKNATEALAAPGLIVPATVLLLGGQVLPPALLIIALLRHAGAAATILSATATLLSYYPRLLTAIRFRQSVSGALLHPLGVGLLVSIQWYALLRHMLGKPVTWRGRT